MNAPAPLLQRLSSKKISLFLFALLAFSLVPFTFYKTLPPFFTPIIRTQLVLLAVNLALCTWNKRKRLRLSVLLIHIGCLLVMTGGLLGSTGFTATVNVYEQDTTTTAYRWDLKKDINLGFGLKIKKINQKYYPVPIKVGVLKNAIKERLLELRTGDSFKYDNYEITIDELNIPAKSLRLFVRRPGQDTFTYNTSASNTLPDDFPLAFQLVAFQTPKLQRVWAEIAISKENKILAAGVAEVNNPMLWQGLRFYHTTTGFDENGRPYAGIQIVRDQGIPLVYFGFSLMIVGLLLLLRTRHK